MVSKSWIIKLVVVLLSLGYALPRPGAAAAPEAAASGQAAGGVSAKQCRECHDASDVKVYAFHSECLACHVGSEGHARAPTQVKATRAVSSPSCLSCHATGKGHARDANRVNFAFSEHHKAGVQCADCHGIHTPKFERPANVADVKLRSDARLCATCHQEVVARLYMRSHHPVREGALSCTSCHQPHESRQTALEGRTEQCTRCHQAVRGPHVFEHPPAAEDCTTCHNPHGSPNARLLELAQPMQCLQCHSLANNRHGRTGSTNATAAGIRAEIVSGAVLRDCVSCHRAVHGSASDQHLRR